MNAADANPDEFMPDQRGWRGALSPDEVPTLTVDLHGFSLNPEVLEARGSGHGGLGIRRYTQQSDHHFRMHLLNEEGAGSRVTFVIQFREHRHAGNLLPPADLAVGVVSVANMGARRRFVATDEYTATELLLSIVSQLQGEGGICVDLADLLHAWEPFVQHEVCWEPWPGDGEAKRAVNDHLVSRFILADSDVFDMALVERICPETSFNPVDGSAMVVGHVLLAEGGPVKVLTVCRKQSLR